MRLQQLASNLGHCDLSRVSPTLLPELATQELRPRMACVMSVFVLLLGACLVSLAQQPQGPPLTYIGANPNVPGTTAAFLLNPDGTGNQLIPAQLVGLGNPRWSRDARLIAAVGTAPGGQKPDIFVFDRTGNNLRQVTNIDASQIVAGATLEQLFSAFSPDGKNFALSELFQVPNAPPGQVNTDLIIQLYSIDGTAGIFVQGLGFSSQTGVAYDNSGWGLDWSPKGNLLALPNGNVEQCSGTQFIGVTEIWSVPLPQASNNSPTLPAGSVPITNSSGEACAILPSQVFNVLPVFSPDGTKVAFVKWIQAVDGSTDSSINVVNLDGTGQQQVAALPGVKTFGLSWSGDGSQLVFDQIKVVGGIPQEQSATLWTVNIDGSGLAQIAGPPNGQPAGEPAWSWVVPAAADFQLAASSGSPTTDTITAGQTALYNLSVTGSGGFSGTVSFTCSGAPAGATCSVAPTAAAVAGSAPANLTVSVTTAPRSSTQSGMTEGMLFPTAFGGNFATSSLIFVLGLMAITLTAKYPVPMYARKRLTVAVIAAGLTVMAACGGGGGSSLPSAPSGGGGNGGSSGSGTAAGTYALVVTGNSGTTSHSIHLTLVVN